MNIELPGFFDLQVNGYAGVDFNDPNLTPDQFQYATDMMRAAGVTRYLPTLITSSLEKFSSCARSILKFAQPAVAGFHMEGPYISPIDGPRGAHPRGHTCAASVEDFKRRQDATAGQIKLVTLAPEVANALSLIEYLVETNVRAAIGHSAATCEQIQDAVKAGATLSTHLGNGCAQVLPRHPNHIWEQLARDELCASLIVDGFHLPPATVKTMVRAKTPPRTFLVTDATAAAGCPPGIYVLSDLEIELSADGRVAAPGSTNLAGSALAMNTAVANAVRFTGLSIDQVYPMASTLPARYLGLEPAGRLTAEWNAKHFVLSVTSITDDAADTAD